MAAIAIMIQFSIFKHFYPFPNFIHGDSFVYLRAAYDNAPVSLHPIGYSKFLRLFSVFSASDMVLTAFQYLLIQVSALGFIFTIFCLYKPRQIIEGLLIATVVFDPIFLHLANLISAEVIFVALSLIWFTLLLWILHRPTPNLIVWHALVLFLAFTVRYNAFYYPIISIVAFLLSRQKLYYKLSGIAAGLLLIGGFIFLTSQEYAAFIGKKVFSPFSGWQLANNALYAYRHIDSAKRKPVPLKFQQVDRIVRTYFDTSRNISAHPMEMSEASTVYMWTPESPLQLYMMKEYRLDQSIKDSSTRNYNRWASAGPLLGEYGVWLIRQYPEEFIYNYLWPNTIQYYTPPLEFLSAYNMGLDTIRPIAQTWFGFKSDKVTTKFRDPTASSLEFYPFFSAIVNGLFLCCILGFSFMIGFKQQTDFSRLVILTGTLWLLNFGFSVFASPIALRYQVFTLLTFLSISLILMDYIYNNSSQKEKGKKMMIAAGSSIIGNAVETPPF